MFKKSFTNVMSMKSATFACIIYFYAAFDDIGIFIKWEIEFFSYKTLGARVNCCPEWYRLFFEGTCKLYILFVFDVSI